ncbi:hypothetical protein [Sphingomonas sp.]|uniref:hypothetical protein n=1 Tax=Sphingomonas sp. TaxID=28214 RepID=UPI002DD69AC9|nr:hypothetical protein [Sphingomonas sp.]
MSILLETRPYHLFIGFLLLVGGMVVMPALASAVIGLAVKLNLLILGSLYEWQKVGFAHLGTFFAVISALVAGYGAAMLAAAMAVRVGLISNPWE